MVTIAYDRTADLHASKLAEAGRAQRRRLLLGRLNDLVKRFERFAADYTTADGSHSAMLAHECKRASAQIRLVRATIAQEHDDTAAMLAEAWADAGELVAQRIAEANA